MAVKTKTHKQSPRVKKTTKGPSPPAISANAKVTPSGRRAASPRRSSSPAQALPSKKRAPSRKSPERTEVEKPLPSKKEKVATSKSSKAPSSGTSGELAPKKGSARPMGRSKSPKRTVVDNLADELQAPEESSVPTEVERLSSYDGDTAFKLYLREIGQIKLLTPEEEVKLAARIKKGDKKAREQMIKANLRLVVKIAHDYEGFGLPLLDLINEGNVGLMKAVERFDPSKGGKLSTYGAWWIKQSIKRALANQSKTIRLPVHLVDKISKMRRTALKLQEEYGREPSDEELGEELGITPARVAQLRTAAIRPASLDAPAGEDDSNNFSERVQDENAQSPYKQLEDQTVTSMLRDLIQNLPERESTILTYRFGLDGGQEKTLEEVGAKFGVTRERVRQIQNIALAKLRKMIEKLEAVQK